MVNGRRKKQKYEKKEMMKPEEVKRMKRVWKDRSGKLKKNNIEKWWKKKKLERKGKRKLWVYGRILTEFIYINFVLHSLVGWAYNTPTVSPADV